MDGVKGVGVDLRPGRRDSGVRLGSGRETGDDLEGLTQVDP